ncbi:MULTISPECIES: glycosyltransferase [unclassified Brevundimonas]|uniref:glycosyltransferase n=1 Tax=unclassified Brevundimonas TaxID=2622653 RepID=UPI0025BC2CD1|nr:MULTISPECIES: glycosyltransferase [unclassified Brevundimonas]
MQAFKRLARWFAGSNDTPLRARGRVAASERRWNDAINAFRSHLKMRPKDTQTWLRLANVLKDAGELAEAERIYEHVITICPENPQAWLNRGHLAKMDGRIRDALQYFILSFQLDGHGDAGRQVRALHPHIDPAATPVARRAGGLMFGRVDALNGRILTGWAVDPDRPAEPVEVEVRQKGAVVGQAMTDVSRPDVSAAGLGGGSAGFRVVLSPLYNRENGPLSVKLSRRDADLINSPFVPPVHDVVSLWIDRWSSERVSEIKNLDAYTRVSAGGAMLSIVMPIYNPSIDWLSEAVKSVVSQIYGCWELICVDDGSDQVDVGGALKEYIEKYDNIKYIRRAENCGISTATNVGISLASGDYVSFMDQDDILEPDAVFRIMDAARIGADLIYSDEAVVEMDRDCVVGFAIRPSFSYDYYLSHPYFVHFVAVRRSIALEVGGLDESMNISMDVDFVLRVIEKACSVAHVPAVLYRWRTHPGSAGHKSASVVTEATIAALERHHARMGRDVVVSPGKTFNTFKGDKLSASGRVLAIVPTKDRIDLIRPCIESVLKTTGRDTDVVVIDHQSVDRAVVEFINNCDPRVKSMIYEGSFNYSRMNNLAFREFGEGYDYVLFLNNDIEAIESGWVEHMRGLCSRDGVGIVGAVLLYGDDSVQHGGVVLGVGGPAEHLYRGEPLMHGGSRNPGYLSGLVSVRDCMAVTGACLMIRAETFKAMNGFDEKLPVGFNDVDLCLRVRQAGEKVLIDGHAVLHHYESATRTHSRQLEHPLDTARMIQKWSTLISEGDPFYHPFFGLEGRAMYLPVGTLSEYHAPRVTKLR